MENDSLLVYNSAIHKLCSLMQIGKKYSFIFIVSLSPILFYFFFSKESLPSFLEQLGCPIFFHVLLWTHHNPLLSLLLFADLVFHVILNCINHFCCVWKCSFYAEEWLSNTITSEHMGHPWASFILWKVFRVGVMLCRARIPLCKAGQGHVLLGLVTLLCVGNCSKFW